MANYKGYQNSECEYFPCHPVKEGEMFNCMFCYCPLYLLKEDCGGNFTYTDKGIKSCMGCTKPHDKDSYAFVQKGMMTVIERAKKKMD